jgi:hypothetical protein
MEKFVARPVITGASAYGFTALAIGNDGYVDALSMELSPALAIATVVVGADIGGSMLRNQLMKTPQYGGLANAESMLLKPAITGTSTMIVSSVLLGPPDNIYGAAKLFAIGAVSTVAGKYVSDAVLPILF